MKGVELMQDAAVFGPTTALVWLLIMNAAALFTMFMILLSVKNKIGEIAESISITDADVRGDLGRLVEIMRCYFFQRSRPKEEDLAGIGTKSE